uniref:Si:dkey-16p21.8 n=1 Tax=Astyanax mexicanus TaxID=7994 RepID=A0A3B1JIE2_ASTMX
MSDSETAAPAETPVPAACEAIKADLDKIKENGEAACKELMEAFAACVKSSAEGS